VERRLVHGGAARRDPVLRGAYADFARTTSFFADGGPAAGTMDALTGHLDAVRLGLEPAGDRQVRTERLAASDDRDGMLRLDPDPPRAFSDNPAEGATSIPYRRIAAQ
jgi:hypothetical protein